MLFALAEAGGGGGTGRGRAVRALSADADLAFRGSFPRSPCSSDLSSSGRKFRSARSFLKTENQISVRKAKSVYLWVML